MLCRALADFVVPREYGITPEEVQFDEAFNVFSYSKRLCYGNRKAKLVKELLGN